MSFKIFAYGTSCVLYPCIEEHYYIYVTNKQITVHLFVCYVNIIICLWKYVRRHCFRRVVFYVPPSELHISDLKSNLTSIYFLIRLSVF